jgi:hypothetical protein
LVSVRVFAYKISKSIMIADRSKNATNVELFHRCDKINILPISTIAPMRRHKGVIPRVNHCSAQLDSTNGVILFLATGK